MIRIYCEAADAVLKETQTLTAGMINYPEVLLTFSDDWDGYGKAAVVRAGEVTVDVLIVNNKFVVPAECLQEAGVSLIVGVSGSDGVHTIPTIWCSCGEIQDGTDVNEASNVGTATPSLVDQMIAYAQAIEDYAEDLDTHVIRTVAANSTGANRFGTAAVDITDTGAGNNRTVTFTFTNLKGNGIESVTWVASGEYRGRIQIRMSDETVYNFDALIEAINFFYSVTQDSEAYAIGTRDGVEVTPTDPAYHNNSLYHAERAGASATAAATSEANAATSATRAEQIAVENGYFYFEIDAEGDLIEYRTDNVEEDLVFSLQEGDLYVTYGNE